MGTPCMCHVRCISEPAYPSPTRPLPVPRSHAPRSPARAAKTRFRLNDFNLLQDHARRIIVMIIVKHLLPASWPG